ncbi:MAG: phosphoenolpyruvate carboxykinase (ATP) [Chloroflexota bacterium]|nr:phosphoenolpyruvate carboxykinase (ATP) [Chloroflexota bacterium]
MTSTRTESSVRRLKVVELANVYRDLSVAALVEHAIHNREGQLAANGALAATTGKRTGRSPGDKFIVRSGATEDKVEWGRINQPIDQQAAGELRERLLHYARDRRVYVLNAFAGADAATCLPIQVITEYAWHNLFARQLFRHAAPAELTDHAPAFTVIAMPTFLAVPERDGTKSETAVIVDFERREVLIAGTEYAGEIKKSIFSVMNFLLPPQGVLPVHCSANVGQAGDVALFFGLSGTGKTSLSSDPERRLIGDDEHGWGENGVFNFEGGCYAKCIRLRREAEPQIYDAIRFGAVMENVVIDPETREPRYDDDSITENTRAAYPLEFIGNIAEEGTGGHPQTIFFLTADAFGVLPPISRLTAEQAMYHFLSGYTAKLAGTEVGLGTDPEATFEACFGSPFLPLPAITYAEMLREKLNRHGGRVYLLNTGWTGGSFGTGSRIKIGYTRAMVHAALAGTLEHAETYTDDRFGLHVPIHIEGVPDELLRPRDTWQDQDAYDRTAQRLATCFIDNFKKYGNELAKFGPRSL